MAGNTGKNRGLAPLTDEQLRHITWGLDETYNRVKDLSGLLEQLRFGCANMENAEVLGSTYGVILDALRMIEADIDSVLYNRMQALHQAARAR